MRPHLAFPTG